MQPTGLLNMMMQPTGLLNMIMQPTGLLSKEQKRKHAYEEKRDSYCT